MQIVGAFEAKTHLAALLNRVEKGEQVVITKHGRPVAKLVAISQEVSQDKKCKAIEQLKIFSQKNHLQGLDWKLLRDEGRRL